METVLVTILFHLIVMFMFVCKNSHELDGF